MQRARTIVRAPRRARQWAQVQASGTIVAATQAGMLVVDLLAGLEADLAMNFSNITAGAMNINVNYRSTGSTTGDDTTVTAAVAWINSESFGLGGTSVPDPFTDHFDWMFYDTRTLTASRDVTDIDEQVFNSQLEIRNRSMRKQRENHSNLVIIFRASLLQQTQLQIFIGGRTLVLLP